MFDLFYIWNQRLFTILVFVLANTTICAQDAKEILDNYFDAVSSGDPNRWENVKTLYSTSVSYFSGKKMEDAFPIFDDYEVSYIRTYKAWPDKMKEELYSDSSYINLASEFYFFKDRRIIKLANMPMLETVGDNTLWFQLLPNIVKTFMKNGKSISYNGIKEIIGIPTPQHEIEIQMRDNIRRLLFNTKTFLLEAIYFPEENIYWIYDQYDEFESFLMPTQVTGMKDGNAFSLTIVKTLSFNQPIDMNKFNYK